MASPTACDEPVGHRPPDRRDAAQELVRSLAEQPWGQLSPSTYETARLVSLAPWLDGHAARLRHLSATQNPDGGWGDADGYGDGYAVVPTLSATEAALVTALRADRTDAARMRRAARNGLAALRSWLAGPSMTLPDTPAVELIVPALVESINARLAEPGGPGGPPLSLPSGVDPATVQAIRSALSAGIDVPRKLLHSLDAMAPLPTAARGLAPNPRWTVGASPAATAAWLGERPHGRRAGATAAIRYLRDVVAHHGGLAPSVIPITTFERAWVLATLADGGLDATGPVAGRLTRQLAASLTEVGTSGGPGLPPDADTTSVVLLALEQRGRTPDLDCLLEYGTATHFLTWPGERTPSTSTNAHVLDALSLRLCRMPAHTSRYAAARDRVATWLLEQQRSDGSWMDKWHASPYYATAASVGAFERCDELAAKPAVKRAVDRAVRWVLRTRRDDGGWGRWASTAEETAYAVRALWARRHGRAAKAALAGARGQLGEADYFARPARGRAMSAAPLGPAVALWHDKDLYHPIAVVRATTLASQELVDVSIGGSSR